MKRSFLLLSLFLLLKPSFLHAKEGMWLPLLLEDLAEGEMKEMGLNIDAEDIYSLKKSGITDAIVHFGGGCTASIISDKGLLLTNHHCGYSFIQRHSSVDNDLLKNGFWADDRSEELKNPGLDATLIQGIIDVSDEMLKGLEDSLTENERKRQMERNKKGVLEEHLEGGLSGRIRSFGKGNAYFLFLTKTFEDVRLVGAPPSGIGKFGGDQDNWMWPRHTGDFALFRIYADEKNAPAPPADANVPYAPEHVIPVSTAGVRNGDFAMIFGFPGSTDQYLPAEQLRFLMERNRPARIRIREAGLQVLHEAMNRSDSLRIMYAGKQSRISNYYKKWQGEIRGLKKIGALERKRAAEKRFLKSAEKKGKADEAKELLAVLKEAYEDSRDLQMARDLFIEFMFYGPDMIRYIRGYQKWMTSYEDLRSEEKLDSAHREMEERAERFFSKHSMEVDQRIFHRELGVYRSYVPRSHRPDFLEKLDVEFDGDPKAYAEHLYENSLLLDPERCSELHDEYREEGAEAITEDPAFQMVNSLYNGYIAKTLPFYRASELEKDSLMRLYIRKWKEFFPEEQHWYDANNTLRLSYGYVEGSAPRDGMNYEYITTLQGVIDKHDTSKKHFAVPKRLRELYRAKDYGSYGVNGRMPVCFSSSLHTSGGNSGSPILGANGELIGLNFDRSWESVMSDLMFDPSRCRNISTDIRYILFIIDKFAGADHLVEEMEQFQVVEREIPGEKTLKKRVEEDPGDAKAWYLLGRRKSRENERKEALDAFSRAIGADPGDPSSYRERARIHLDMGSTQKACKDLRVLRRLDPLMLPEEEELPDCERM